MLQNFLAAFVPQLQKKFKQANLATWILETTGSEDAATLKADLETEYRLLFNNREHYDQLLKYDPEDPLLKRQLNVLLRMHKPHLIPSDLLETLSKKEAELSLLYSNFRPTLEGKSLSENEIRAILKNEKEVQKRKDTWEASKQIGKELKPSILELVHLRNEAAKTLGYSDYFSMQLELQEVDQYWLFETLDQLAKDSDSAYTAVLNEIEESAKKRYSINEIGPWAWSEPFCQEDPLDASALDQLVSGLDLLQASLDFYQAMHLDVKELLKRGDHFERPGKNQHAFCLSIDREKDVRILNNIQPSIKWMETVLHELGHGVYDLGYDPSLPWLLKEPPHMITTEAMALLAGRQAYRKRSLEKIAPLSSPDLREKAEISLKRRQLIFSRWVLVMTYFEKELYQNPAQDLNQLWWSLVKKFQKIDSSGSKSGADWAAKYHIGLAPVYYFSYLLGELFASTLEEKIKVFASKETGSFLQDKLFKPGNRFHWNDLVKHATGEKLSPEAWLKQFT